MALKVKAKTGTVIAFLMLILASASLSVFEGWHHVRYGHFIDYGLHTDVVLGDSDVGKGDTYYARAWNLSASTVLIEGCRLPGGSVGSGILYRWDVQRLDPLKHQWNSLRGANNWVQELLTADGIDANRDCKREITRIGPLATRRLGWVFRSWVTRGDSVRMAIHTSIDAPLDRQWVIYTPIFSIKQ